ncbi:hypothetical protein [Herbidospora mongoliensis]|uniref:hypothetical protein n=1 Tax=Herbidospora mongoliensis TaxID=688067 RepID=UPI0012FB2C2D|nr:hypothetical protein [Herbidospora mongoliensis]
MLRKSRKTLGALLTALTMITVLHATPAEAHCRGDGCPNMPWGTLDPGKPAPGDPTPTPSPSPQG